MAKKPDKKIVQIIKKLAREKRLEQERLFGKPRAKTYGGKPNAKENRKTSKNQLRNLDGQSE